jgi:mRNA interferase MazF
MAEVNQGEIWQFSFPHPNKRRLVLILTRQEVISHWHSITVAPITTTIRSIPSEVVIGPESGLRTTTAINLDNLATVPKDGCAHSSGRYHLRYSLPFERHFYLH